MERDGPWSPLEILRGGDPSQSTREGTWEVRAREGETPQRTKVRQQGKGPSFSIVCWCQMLSQ